ncbi:hypothetical protein ACN4EK_06380 [Pantanalinema rosaneae CENA516]|uniref:hypothetical protein n=1 Tax=Pantanalinema rosaneae TaxID=1620701 RepID=UPI003D6F9707
MSNDSVPTLHTSRKPTFSDRIRDIANQLRQESEVQIKATSRILGAAAQIAQNHDHLIDEVIEMVEEDLNQQAQAHPLEPYTVENLQQQFKTLKDAKAHFSVKVSSWAALVAKLNEQRPNSQTYSSESQAPVIERLEAIEQEVQALRGDTNQILNLLSQVLKKLS